MIDRDTGCAKKFNIGFIHLNYPRPQSISEASAATDYIRYMNEKGHDVTVYCPEKPDSSNEIADDLNTRFLDIDPSFPRHKGEELNRSILARKELRDHDILHSYSGRALPAIGQISRETTVNTLVTLNAYNSVCPKNDLRFLDRYQCNSRGNIKCSLCTFHSSMSRVANTSSSYSSEALRAGHIQTSRFRDIRISNKSQKYLKDIDLYHVYSHNSKIIYDKFGYPIEKFFVVPIPVHKTFLEKRRRIPDEPYKLLYVGRLSKAKGVDRLPSILNSLINRYDHKVELDIVGKGGDLENKLIDTFREYELEQFVSFEGYVPNHELPSIYNDRDVFVYPGRVEEAFGRVFLESLASSTPVVSSDIGAAEEIIENGGITVSGNSTEFAKEISKLLNHSVHYTYTSDRAYERASEYTLQKVGDRLEKMYMTLMY